MSTDNIDNSVDASDDVNLDDFSAEFFGQNKAEPEPASSKVEEEDITDADAPAEDTHDDEDDTLATDEEDDEPEIEEEAPKPKKNRLQERIDQLVHKEKEKDRQLQAALARLDALENKTNEPEPKANKLVVDTAAGPDPAAQNEDGTDKYPLGEFDPNYIRDLTKYTIAEERKAAAEEAKREAEQAKANAEADSLRASWEEKLTPAQERYPDFQEKGLNLVDAFSNVDAAYGEYITQTIMSMEYGPDVLYYLANNLDEADKIMKSGARQATISLGRLEAKFAYANEEKQRARPKVSKAPAPPEHLNKGSSVAVGDIPDDTDDLDLFEKKFYSAKRRY